MRRWLLGLLLLLPSLGLAQNQLINGGLIIVGSVNYCEPATASGTTYACNLSPAISVYTAGALYTFKADVANTGAATINFNGAGAKSMVTIESGVATALVAGDIRAGAEVHLLFDGTNMQMLSRSGNHGKRYLTVEVVADATALATGDGLAYVPISPDFNGWAVVGVSAHVGAVVSSSGAVNVDLDVCGAVATGIRCSGTNRDLLSTNLTIDANEDGTETAATAAVINTTANAHVLATGEWLRYNIDSAGTGTQGLYVTIVLQKP